MLHSVNGKTTNKNFDTLLPLDILDLTIRGPLFEIYIFNYLPAHLVARSNKKLMLHLLNHSSIHIERVEYRGSSSLFQTLLDRILSLKHL